jgi:TP901 family phage tail tape measure protein
MSISALEKLMFTVGLTDLVSKPALSINKTINGMKHNATSGFDAIRGGAFGLAGAGIAIKTFMQPVYDVEKALGEVKSLGVIDSELKSLTKESLKFSMAYGESASDFISSSYDIQSAISGLTNGELAKFTNASNILAKGTKADAGTITSYMGTMYGIFSDQANKMGKAKWVEQLTGQTALAVQMFKTDGANMSAAFTSIGANATASGVAINEQMAILGSLQATMSGSESGTKYKAFLAGVAGAQNKLGLSFTDSHGRLLPMLDILGSLKNKFGGVLDESEKLDIKTAFGSGEALSLITQLMTQTDGLTNSMDKLGKVTGMKNAQAMAKTMVEPWERFQAVTKAVRISFSTLLMPAINDLLFTLSNGMQTLIGWTDTFPNITKYVGIAALAILGMSAATGLFSIVLGLGKTALAAWGGGVLLVKGAMIALTAMATPIGFLAMAIAGLVWYWDDLKESYGDTFVFKGLDSIFTGWSLIFKELGKVDWLKSFGKAIDFIMPILYKLNNIIKYVFLGSLRTINSIFVGWELIIDGIGSAFLGLGQTITGLFEKIVGKFTAIKKLLGFGDGGTVNVNGAQSVQTQIMGMAIPQNLNSDTPQINGMGKIPTWSETKDGLAKQIANAMAGGGANFGDVTINAEGGMTPEALETWGVMQGG